MKRLKELMIATLMILFMTVPVMAVPQQSRQRDCDDTVPLQPDCQQDQQRQRDVSCDGISNDRGYRGKQGQPGGGPRWGLNQEVIPLTDIEIPLVLAMREEEKLARDVYLTLDEQFLSPIFESIARSEQRHMDAVGRIITLQGLQDPVTNPAVGVFTNPGFTELYDALTEQGSADYLAALQIGAYIEEIDIQDLHEALDIVTNPQLLRVFKNLLRGSYNHLRAFTAALEAEGVTYAPQVLAPEVYDAILNPPAQ